MSEYFTRNTFMKVELSKPSHGAVFKNFSKRSIRSDNLLKTPPFEPFARRTF